MELLKSRTGISAVHVPYPGYPQVVTAMLGGQIQLSMLPPGLAMTQARAGKVKVIGVTSAGRSTLVPEVPSLSEAGVRDFQLDIWNAVAGPATLPRAVRDRLSNLISEIARSPEVRQKLFQQGWQVAGTSAEGLAKRMQADYSVLGRVIAQQGIKAE
jgi:tripartite-type tricarboxylate transporter receptor subunit TctC